MSDNKISVLYVDDEANNLTGFKATFRREFQIYTAESATEGLNILDNHQVEVIITDQRMPQMTGIEFLVQVLQKHPDPIRILLTGYSDINAVIDAINQGQVYRYISKPWGEAELRMTINNASELYNLREQNRKLTENLKIVNQQLEFVLRQQLLD